MKSFFAQTPQKYSLELHLVGDEGEVVNIGDGRSITAKNPTEAFGASIIMLRSLMPSSDIFSFEADGDTTIVRECTDDSVYILIKPNILDKDTPIIGPYSLKLRQFLKDLPEN